MKIKVNGKEQDLPNDSPNLLQILKLNNVIKPELVSVQLNEEFVEPEKFSNLILKENDEVDFLYFMGGGCC